MPQKVVDSGGCYILSLGFVATSVSVSSSIFHYDYRRISILSEISIH